MLLVAANICIPIKLDNIGESDIKPNGSEFCPFFPFLHSTNHYINFSMDDTADSVAYNAPDSAAENRIMALCSAIGLPFTL